MNLFFSSPQKIWQKLFLFCALAFLVGIQSFVPFVSANYSGNAGSILGSMIARNIYGRALVAQISFLAPHVVLGEGEEEEYVRIEGDHFVVQHVMEFIPAEREFSVDIWMIGESSEVFAKDFENFESFFPNIDLQVTAFADIDTYFSELEKAMNRGETPDIFMVNSAWFRVLQQNKKLAPAPPKIFHANYIDEFFYPIAGEFVNEDKVFAAPLYGNFIVTIYNSALLTNKNIFVAEKPGKTWGDISDNFKNYQKFGDSKIIPIAIGNAQFSPKTFDIFLLLLGQAGIENFSEKNAEDALSFLLGFASDLPSSTQKYSDIEMFVDGKVAILFGDENTYQEIIALIRKNTKPQKTDLKEENIGVQILPQFDISHQKTIGDIWGFAVSKHSLEKEFAWAFITSLTDEAKAKQHYLKTQQTPLLKALPNELLVAESPEYAFTGGERRTLDFQMIFEENTLAYLSPEDPENVISLEEILQIFTEFFPE